MDLRPICCFWREKEDSHKDDENDDTPVHHGKPFQQKNRGYPETSMYSVSHHAVPVKMSIATIYLGAFFGLAASQPLRAQVVAYEALRYPLEDGWSYTTNYCQPQEWLQDGWLVHHVEMCPNDPPPGGQQIGYTRSPAEFNGISALFFQFRLVTDGPSTEFSGVAPCSLSVASQCGVNYRFVISADKAKLNRDNLLPIIIVDIQPGVPHTYRLELYGAEQYVWTIDGRVADAGVPEGAYPCLNPAINFRTKANTVPNTTRWDYIRFGVIPRPGSGDFDSNGVVDATDVYYFLDCLLGPDADGPGCRWADMNGDGKVNGDDIQPFAALVAG